MSRSISNATPDQKSKALIHDLKSYGKSGLNWILAGLFVCFGCYLISWLDSFAF